MQNIWMIIYKLALNSHLFKWMIETVEGSSSNRYFGKPAVAIGNNVTDMLSVVPMESVPLCLNSDVSVTLAHPNIDKETHTPFELYWAMTFLSVLEPVSQKILNAIVIVNIYQGQNCASQKHNLMITSVFERNLTLNVARCSRNYSLLA